MPRAGDSSPLLPPPPPRPKGSPPGTIAIIVAAAAAGGLLAISAFVLAIVLSSGGSTRPPSQKQVASAPPSKAKTNKQQPTVRPKAGQIGEGTTTEPEGIEPTVEPTAPQQQTPVQQPVTPQPPSVLPSPEVGNSPATSPETNPPSPSTAPSGNASLPAEAASPEPPSSEKPAPEKPSGESAAPSAAPADPPPAAPADPPPAETPAAPEPEAAPKAPPQRTTDELRDELRRVAHAISADEVIQALAGNKRMTDAARQELVEEKAELRGVPFRWGGECRSDRSHTQALGKLSFEVRRLHDIMVAPLAKLGDTPEAEAQRAKAFAEGLDKQPWRSGAAIPAFEQMLQPEGLPVRLQLVKMLNDIGNSDASKALAHRAMYDLSGEVRAAAIRVLKTRPRDHYEQTLLDGFRHPWQQVAWNCAEAAVQLNAQHLQDGLTKLLEQPDPAGPQHRESGEWVVREVACVNHFRSCLLCHASSISRRDPVRGPIPVLGEPLPNFTYQSPVGNFVRADVTYLKQDFSAMQPVEDPGPWPKMQRFDYFVRERTLDAKEALAAEAAASRETAATYPQRQAVRYALERLRGMSALERPAAGWLVTSPHPR